MSTSTSLHPTPARTGPSTSGDRPTAADALALTQLLRRLHFYAGVLVGPFLLVAALSGFLYALSPSLDGIYHHDLLTAASPEQHVPMSHQVATAEKALGSLQATSVVVPRPGETTMVLFADPSLPDGYSRAAFVDPADGHLHGTSTVFGSTYALPERAWIDQLHDNLHLGEAGRLYSELAASWLAPVTLVGLLLWWRQRRNNGHRRPADGRRPSTRAQTRAWHTTTGLVCALGLLFLSATGLTWSKYAGDHVDQLRTALGWRTPTVSTALPGGPASSETSGGMAGMDMGPASGNRPDAGGVGTMTADHLMPGMLVRLDAGAVDRVAATAARSLRPPYAITVGGMGAAWTAKETRHSFTLGPDAVAIAPKTGKVTSRVPFSGFPLAAKLTDWGIRLHMGFLFGLANQLLLAALALALAAMTVLGYRMWWQRRPTRGGARVGRPPVRGALARLFRARPVVCSLAAIAVLALGWAVPLLGVSLLGFLVVDSAIASAHRQTTGHEA